MGNKNVVAHGQYLRQNTFWLFFLKRVFLRISKDQPVAMRHIIHFYPFLSTGEGIVMGRFPPFTVQ
ncbi:MAG: hypothetical protein D3924_19950 [Candidatus Electrothrix sp. AR4]|nr:hypothetical protein [Candidatus Electrothrix sp. AR4]